MMTMKSFRKHALLHLSVWLTLVFQGCSPSASPQNPSESATSRAVVPHAGPESAADHHDDHAHGDDHRHDHDHGHSHELGPHGGVLAEWGEGNFHVELVVNHRRQQATVFVLGSDAKTRTAVHPTDGKLLLTIFKPRFQIEMAPQPQGGDAAGSASRFVGQHESLATEQEFSGTISAEVDGVPYAGDFQE
jgi:hypothetical protein